MLTTRDEAELSQLADRLARSSIPHTCIYEPDPPYCGALMAIGLRPDRKEVLKRLLSSLPLLK